MSKQNIISGRYVKFDVSGTRVTEALQRALDILDGECRNGPGGTWDISRDGRKYVATPVDGPFDTLYFNTKSARWSE